MSDMPPLVDVDQIGPHSFQAHQDGYPVFVIRQTTAGWKTEGHPVHDGLLCGSKDELIDRLEGRNR